MKDGNIMIKNINILGSRASELMNKNKILSGQITYYEALFNSNKKYITEYFNTISQAKATSKNSKIVNKNNNVQKIKDILIKYNSELKLSHENNYKSVQNFKDKYNIYTKKLNCGTNNLLEKKEKISEDNFLYKNEIKSKENLILCLNKDLKIIKKHLYEDVKHIYLYYNFNSYSNNSTSNNKNNKSAIFEDGEKVINNLLKEEKRKYYISMKQRINTRQKYGRMNIKKSALNDLVTSFSFINETEITPSFNNNIFTLLNKKIGGVVKNYEKFFDNEIIDENFFIFLPFELEMNKDEINDLMQTDLTLPNNKFKLQTKLNKENDKDTNNKVKAVPKLDFLLIEFNKEKVEFSQSDESDGDDGDKLYNNNYNGKNIKQTLEMKIKEMKRKIRSLKKENKKLKNLINDFNKFQEKIKGKFQILEQNILKEKEKEEDKIKESDLIE